MISKIYTPMGCRGVSGPFTLLDGTWDQRGSLYSPLTGPMGTERGWQSQSFPGTKFQIELVWGTKWSTPPLNTTLMGPSIWRATRNSFSQGTIYWSLLWYPLNLQRSILIDNVKGNSKVPVKMRSRWDLRIRSVEWDIRSRIWDQILVSRATVRFLKIENGNLLTENFDDSMILYVVA